MSTRRAVDGRRLLLSVTARVVTFLAAVAATDTLAGTNAAAVAALRAEVAKCGWILFAAKTPAGDYDLFLARPDGTSVRTITNTPEFNEYGGRFSPDGKRILYRRIPKADPVSHDLWGAFGVPFIAAADGSNPAPLGKDKELPWAVWGPDTKRVSCLYKREGKIRIVDLESRAVLKELPRQGIFQQLFWSPDGEKLCGTANVAGQEWNVVGIDVATGKLKLLSRELDCTPDWFNRSPRAIYSNRRPGLADGYGWTMLMQADAGGKSRTLVYAEREKHIYFGCLSPDDTYVLFSVMPQDSQVEAPMAIVRLTDTPMIVPGGGSYKELEALYPNAKDGPVLRLSNLPPGFEPHWTYAEIAAP